MIRMRKKSLNIETVWHEGGPVAAVPLRLGSAVAVVENPFAGRYVENLDAFVADARELANQSTAELVAALGGRNSVEAYGKGAIVGVAGELEHGAIWHEAGGWAMRAALDFEGDRARRQSRRVGGLSPACACAPHQRSLCSQPFQRVRHRLC